MSKVGKRRAGGASVHNCHRPENRIRAERSTGTAGMKLCSCDCLPAGSSALRQRWRRWAVRCLWRGVAVVVRAGRVPACISPTCLLLLAITAPLLKTFLFGSVYSDCALIYALDIYDYTYFCMHILSLTTFKFRNFFQYLCNCWIQRLQIWCPYSLRRVLSITAKLGN